MKPTLALGAQQARTAIKFKEVQNMKIAVLPGDGIGTEIVAEAVKVLNAWT